MLIWKMRLNPATIGVVMSAATPQAVKQQARAMNSTNMPLPIRGRLCAGCSAAELSAAVLTIPPLEWIPAPAMPSKVRPPDGTEPDSIPPPCPTSTRSASLS